MTHPYGYAHQKARTTLLPAAYGTPCPLCGRVMVYGQALDLDHSVPVVMGGVAGDRIAHARCNRRAGQALGKRRARARRARVRRLVTSRSW